jgi:hypothetical protein
VRWTERLKKEVGTGLRSRNRTRVGEVFQTLSRGLQFELCAAGMGNNNTKIDMVNPTHRRGTHRRNH